MTDSPPTRPCRQMDASGPLPAPHAHPWTDLRQQRSQELAAPAIFVCSCDEACKWPRLQSD
eukprot:93515-Karenia_brevis.AAC.1